MNLKNYIKSNKKKSVVLISLIIIGVGVIPLLIFTFWADLNNPYTIQEINLTSEDGTELTAWVYTPAGVTGNHPGVVVGHGFCSNKGFMHPLSIELVKRGFSVVNIDFRGHGSSGGYLPSIRADAEASGLVGDMEAAISYLQSLGNIDKIGLVGHSMGGRTSYATAEKHTNIINATVSIGMISIDFNLTKVRNILNVLGQVEQIFSTDNAIEFIKSYTGLTTVELGKLYGSFSGGNATKAVLGPMSEHLSEVINSIIIYETVQWFEQAFNGQIATDVVITVGIQQTFLIIALIGVISLSFVVLVYLSNRTWARGLEKPEREMIQDVPITKLSLIYILGILVGTILLIPLSILFPTVLPVSTGNLLYAQILGNSIGVFIMYYLLIMRKKEKQKLSDFPGKIKAMCSISPTKSLLFGIIAAVLIAGALTLLMHWTTTTLLLTAREIGTIFGLVLLFFPFFLIKEYYMRMIQGQLKTDNRAKEYFSMVGVGILIDNLLYILAMPFVWQSTNQNMGFLALVLTVIVLMSVILNFLVTWVYMHSGRNILGSTIFLCIFYAWMIVNFFPFGIN